MMQSIDYIYRFDPENPSAKPSPPDAAAAKQALEQGNRVFAQWMESCAANLPGSGPSRFVVMCNAWEMGVRQAGDAPPKPNPFAVVVGCSDPRVPTEMLFGQGFNDLFVIRVAGNVLGSECLGSIDFALSALRDSVRVLVVLGHSGCGAVTGAVEAYLQPPRFWSKAISPNLRAIEQRIFVAVREAANGLEQVWGADARRQSGFREALIDAAVGINAAQAALDLRQEVERAGIRGIEVLYGIYNLSTHRVTSPLRGDEVAGETPSQLDYAPTNPSDFNRLAVVVAEQLLRQRESRPG